MKSLKISIIFLLLLFLIMGFWNYSLSHGKMYMDRIMAMSEDASIIFIGDLTRSQIIGPYYLHTYQFSISVNGEAETKLLTFKSLSSDIESHDTFLAYTGVHDHETTVSRFKLDYRLDNQEMLHLESGELVANFVTKTHPNYFRYLSNGTWQSMIGGVRQDLLVLTDHIISPDAWYAQLRPGTQISGYMGAYTDNRGNLSYIDISEVHRKWPGEWYTPHSYLLTYDNEKRAKKVFGLEVVEDGDAITFSKDTWIMLRADKRNLSRISKGNVRDAYYTLVGTTWSWESVRGFLNLVR